jgi:hypothetical protein
MSRRLPPKPGYLPADAELNAPPTKAQAEALKKALSAREKKLEADEQKGVSYDMCKRPDKVQILPVKDGYAAKKIKHWLWDLPARLALVGRSEASGKTTWLLNMLLRFYDPSPWKGKNIFIISGTATADRKVKMLQRSLGIPHANVFGRYSDSTLAKIYDVIKDNHAKNPEEHSLVILDDVTQHLQASNNGGTLGEMAFAIRHQLGSVILLTQKWTMVPTGLRENLSGAVVWGCAQRQVMALANDLNRFDTTQAFYRMVKNCTTGHPHNFLVVRLNKPVAEMYLDTNFKPITARGEDDVEEHVKYDEHEEKHAKNKTATDSDSSTTAARKRGTYSS